MFSCHLALGSLKISQMEGRLLHFLVDVVELDDEGFAGLLCGGLGASHLFGGRPHIADLSQNLVLVLVNPKIKNLQSV